MPWEDILNDLRKNVADRDFMEIPRPAECLKYILKVHLNVAGLDLKKTLKQLYVRPYVLVQLLYVLIDNGHEVFRGKGCAEALKEQMRAAVEREYPETEGHLPEGERQGAPPQPIIQALRAVEAEAQTGDAKEADAMCRPLRKRIRVNADKNATPGDGARSIEECLTDIRPHAVSLERSTAAASDPATLREAGLARVGDLQVHTGNKFIPQWHTKYFSQILPFVIPRMVSGPDYDPNPGKRWRRAPGDPWVDPNTFCAGFARRVEAQCRTDWNALPIVRTVTFKWTAEHTMASIQPFMGKRGSATQTDARMYVEAAQNLYKHLLQGFSGKGVHRVPIAGDTTRLPFANGLTPLERKMAWAQHFLAKHLGGTQQVRQLMGHTQFGARVTYGDCIFFTISPNEQHSALVLRLSRFRKNDPYVLYNEKPWGNLARESFPGLEAKRTRKDGAAEDIAEIEFPEYDLRRAAAARDPHAVVEAYKVEILLRLAAVLGVRMCPRCPRCNDSRVGCQDIFGNNMRPMGGVLGGMTAFGGATEHQGHGTPHFHANGHIVCAYQYGTLADIAAKIQRGELSVESLKAYQNWLHAEDVFDEAQHQEFLPNVETEWQQRFRGPEHTSLCTTPSYLHDDSQMTDVEQTLAGVASGNVTLEQLEKEGHGFRTKYFADAQFVFSRVQHHVHLKTKHGYVPLKACAKKTKKKSKAGACGVCKADFPKTRFCTPKPLVVCRGIARKFGLRTSGRRNAFGSIIGKRTCKWQSGTTPSFAVLFRSNTHTMPNYRVPVLPETHEAGSCPSKACAEHVEMHTDTKKISKVAQRAQREATGYYCGYCCKRQPVGNKHMRAAGEALNYLTTGMEDKSAGQRWHMITHRILADLQHRCMTRTAPEEWNLASNHHPHDVMNAEFLRTYRSVEFPGGQLVRRLEAEVQGAGERETKKVIPAKQAKGTSPLLLKDFVDFYGFRGTDPRVYRLNPWEFLRLWEVLPLPKPPFKADPNRVSLSTWTGEVSINADGTEERLYGPNPLVASAKAGSASYLENIVFFPELSGDVQLRQRWYMQRRRRPIVPAPMNTPVPDKQSTPDAKARLFSVYMRPWVLERRFATKGIAPHLVDLDLVQDQPTALQPARRLSGKQPSDLAEPSRSYARAWTQYVRGGIVTAHARGIIVQFMAANCGKSGSKDLEPDDDAAQRRMKDLPENTLPLQRVHGILDRMSEQDHTPKPKAPGGKKKEDEEAVTESEEDADKKALQKSKQMQGAMETTASLWRRTSVPWPEVQLRLAHSTLDPATRVAGNRRKQKPRRGGQKQFHPAAHQQRAYVNWSNSNADSWLAAEEAKAEPPTAEQRVFLRAIITRCQRERGELASASKQDLSEPMRACLFGIPGAGKSHCIKLVRRFFEECLKWEDGVQFKFLASQNTMAALIGGATVHTWGVIPVSAMDAESKVHSKSTDGDIDELFLNALGVRWLIIDECSTMSPGLLGLLEAYLRRACQRHPYAFWRDQKKGRVWRPFGGINIIFAGDLWQLPPVRAMALFANPFKNGNSAQEQKIFSMFWDCQNPSRTDGIQHMFELTKSMRTPDPWLKAVLDADRYGTESWEMYCFTHGLPTRHHGRWLPEPFAGEGARCERCEGLASKWEQEFRRKRTWALRRSDECEECRLERTRRCCIIRDDDENTRRYALPPFANAPFVHPFRHPSCHAQQLRTINFAKTTKSRLLWVTAHDELQKKDGGRRQANEEERKERWLEFHDRHTSGIPGLLPLVLDLPVRFTQAPNAEAKRLGIFTNKRGWLRGWELHPEEEARLAATDDPEVVLHRRPTKLLIEPENASKELPQMNGKRIYSLSTQAKPWSIDAAGHVKVTRYGFPIVPDFGGTAHAYCGSSLDACLGDCLPWYHRPRLEDQLRAYIIKSRVKDNSKLLLAQPYSPQLFRQGVLPGPYLLREVLAKRMTSGEAKAEWKRVDRKKEEGADDRASNEKWPFCMELPCRICTDDNNGVEVRKPLSAFTSRIKMDEIWKTDISKGQDLVCVRCMHQKLNWKQSDAVMPCDNCNVIRAKKWFNLEMQHAWEALQDEPLYCRSCTGEGKKWASAEMIRCNTCREELPDHFFEEAQLTGLRAEGSNAVALRAECARCVVKGKNLDSEHMNTCHMARFTKQPCGRVRGSQK